MNQDGRSPVTLYVKNRKEWRRWLSRNFRKETEIWLVYPKKGSGRERIPYNDAVEEALCFGWIDSTVRSLDDQNSMQRFTPRRKGSTYSQQNRERLKWLRENDLVHPSLYGEADRVLSEPFVFPGDILEIIRKDPEAWKNYRNFSEAYRRIRIAYIDGARSRPDEFQKRLLNFLKKTRENRMIGFGGIDKYY